MQTFGIQGDVEEGHCYKKVFEGGASEREENFTFLRGGTIQVIGQPKFLSY